MDPENSRLGADQPNDENDMDEFKTNERAFQPRDDDRDQGRTRSETGTDSATSAKTKRNSGLTVNYKNLLKLSDMLDVNKDIEKNPENDNSFENYEVEENKRVDGQDVNEETQSLNGQEKLGPLSKKDTTVKWCKVLLAIGVLCFFAYDAIWADPYLAWRYYEVFQIQLHRGFNETEPASFMNFKYSMTTLSIFILGSTFASLFCAIGIGSTEIPEKYPDKYRTWRKVILVLCIFFSFPFGPFALRVFIIYLMIVGYKENKELYTLLKHRGIGSAIMVICTEDIPQAVLQLYIYLRKEYALEDIGDDWDDTKHLTLLTLASSLAGICCGASFILLQLSELYHEANPKNNKVYDTNQGKFYTFGRGNLEESIVYALQMPRTKILASVGFISFSLLNILSTLFILSHVTAELWPNNFGLYYIAARLTLYYLLAFISWWAEEGPPSFLHSLTYIIVMLSRVPILDKSHSKLGQRLYMILVTLDIPINLAVYFYANNWNFALHSLALDITLCTMCGICFLSSSVFFLTVCLSRKNREQIS